MQLFWTVCVFFQKFSMCKNYSWTSVSFTCSSVPCFFPQYISNCLHVSTWRLPHLFLQLMHSSYLISSTGEQLECFQVSAILVEAAMPNFVGHLFACLSETWVWVLATLPSSSPLFLQSAHFPTSIAPDSLLGRFSILWTPQFLSDSSNPREIISLLNNMSFRGQRICWVSLRTQKDHSVLKVGEAGEQHWMRYHHQYGAWVQRRGGVTFCRNENGRRQSNDRPPLPRNP